MCADKSAHIFLKQSAVKPPSGLSAADGVFNNPLYKKSFSYWETFVSLSTLLI